MSTRDIHDHVAVGIEVNEHDYPFQKIIRKYEKSSHFDLTLENVFNMIQEIAIIEYINNSEKGKNSSEESRKNCLQYLKGKLQDLEDMLEDACDIYENVLDDKPSDRPR